MSDGADHADRAGQPAHVEKIMSLALDEFTASIVRVGACQMIDRTSYRFAVGTHGRVDVTYKPRSSVTYGGLLHLPRAIVCIACHNISEDERIAFISQFDRTFQRGGG